MISVYLAMIETEEHRALLETIYYEYRDIMFLKARSLLRDDFQSEDAVHTAFLRVAKNFNKIVNKLVLATELESILSGRKVQDACPKVGGYMVIVVKNVCLDMLNSKGDKRTVYTDNNEYIEEIAHEQRHESADEIMYMAEKVEDILSAIENLNDTYRETLYLYVVLEMDAREIAESIGCSYETARKRIQRGCRALREVISKNDR